MELKIIRQQRGFLLIIAVIAIVIIGIIGGILATMYAKTAKSTTNSYQSKVAFYIAKSGLEIVRRDLLKTGSTLTCSAITGTSKYTDSCYPPGATNCTGYFSVTSLEKNLSSTLANNISSSTSTVILNNITNFLQSGVVIIDSEAIWYNGISGNQLLNVKRGAFNTTANSHTIGTAAVQKNCLLTSTSSVPTIANPDGKRTIQELLWKNPNGSGGGVGTLPNGMSPGLVAAGSISLTGNSSVSNPNITSINDPNIFGSTIVSGGPIVFNGNANTTIANGVEVSYSSHIGPDVDQNDSRINLGTIWGYFFSQSKTAFKNSLPSSSIITNCSTYNFATASGTLWLDCGNFNPTDNIVIGSPTNPVTLIVNSNINMSSNAVINGFLYTTGCLSVGGNSQVNGLTVVEGAVNLNGNHDSNFNSQILSLLGFMNSASSYSNYYVAEELSN